MTVPHSASPGRPLRRVLRAALCVLALAQVAGCSWILDDEGWIQDRRNEYREAQPTREPVIPADLDGSGIQEAMFVPEVPGMDKYREQPEFELPRPATLFAREEDRGVRIQRFAGDAWIVAPDSPSTVWPRVKQFLSDNGISVVDENPEAGLMETEWVRVEDTDYRDVVRATIRADGATDSWHRLRVSVEQAVRRGATEVHLQQVAGTEPRDDVDWPVGPQADKIADDLLGELAGYLAADVGAGGVSFVAQNIASESKAELVRLSNTPPVLRLRLDFGRAWATVNTALDNAEITVDSADQDERIYRIRYNEAQFRGEETGWFANLFDFGSNDPEGQPFVLRLAPVEGGYDVEVLDADAGPVDRDTGEQLLSVLREFAS